MQRSVCATYMCARGSDIFTMAENVDINEFSERPAPSRTERNIVAMHAAVRGNR